MRNFAQALRALGKDLEGVLRTLAHDRERALDEFERDLVLEKVAHRIDEDHARLRPSLRGIEKICMKRRRETRGVTRAPHRVQSFRHALRVAVLAALADLAAAGYRVPRHLGPLDARRRR